jgi:aryl-alcohol dehydrogenase-like predicted oxidoreductase
MTDEKRIASLSTYTLLGRSGLRVSQLCLGTMTFANEAWGCDARTSEEIFDRYLEAGGNFIDTADLYSGGESEKLLGQLMSTRTNRDRLVLATKFNFSRDKSDPNAGGNSRKHLHDALDASLERLQTDYIDLYWMHAWDTFTPLEEVLDTLDELVRHGKIRYYGFSDTPAWYVGKVCGLAQAGGRIPPIALQLEYSLAVRDIEREFVPAAQHMGLGICPWSPLASGLLTGKYQRGEMGEGRLKAMKNAGNPVFEKLTDRNFDIVDALVEVADGLGRHPAQVALNWCATQPGMTSTIIGATKMSQLESNLGALEFDLPDDARKRLDDASAIDPGTPYMFYDEPLYTMSNGENPVVAEPPGFRG